MKCKPRLLIQYREDRARAIYVRCKSWDCEHCRQKRLRQLRCKALKGNPNTFITLTTNPHTGEGPTDRAKTAVKAWRKLVARIKRYYHYKSLEYLIVVEETKRGEPHLHIIARSKWIDQRWLSEQWQSLTGAKIVDIRRVNNPRSAANYVSKYITKNPAQFRGVRRYNASRHWCAKAPKRTSDEFWKGAETRELDLDEARLIDAWKGKGWCLIADGDHYTEWQAPPGRGPPPLWAAARPVER